ncbi:MAG TPA: hypothetical protein VGY76_04750 [Solirubrobacteraceae bacterium]|nr:hypothetical protein [Solirubrobacteraceae bacterium]
MPLICHGCYFDKPVNLMTATAVEIRLTACHLPGLAAEQLVTRGDLDLSRSKLGVVSLPDAHLGRLLLSGATLSSGSFPLDLGDGSLHAQTASLGVVREVSLVADRLKVDGSVSCRDGFRAQGEVSLHSAHITGQLRFDKATLDRGLTATRLKVDGGMSCQDGFSAQGEVSLLAAHITGQLRFDKATLNGGLTADRLKVDGEMLCQDGFSTHGKVSLHSAHITGHLSFDKATLEGGLNADELKVDGGMFCMNGFSAQGEMRLLGAHIIGQLRFDKATLGQGLIADQLKVDGGMFCRDGFSAQGEMRLLGAHITGHLSFDKATLEGGLNADELKVDGGMSCQDGFSAQGEVRLHSAHITGQLGFDSATLGQGLTADQLKVDGGMFCRDDFSAQGEVSLLGAHITGQLGFNSATLGQGLTADQLKVDGGMFCMNGFSAQGEVRLTGAHITGQLAFCGAKPNDVGALRLGLHGARVDEDLVLYATEGFADEIDLRNARVARLLDDERICPQRLRLGGLVYGAVSAVADQDHGKSHDQLEGRLPEITRWRLGPTTPEVAHRLRWIRCAEEGSGDESSTGDGYMPQPYTQLMTFYRQEGRDSDARRVAYERECRRRHQLGRASKVWNGFLRWTVGYGYRPLRALVLLVVLLAVGTFAFSHFHAAHEIIPLKAAHPPFVAITYTLDRLIPVVNFGLREAYALKGTAQWWAFSYTLFGWALSIAVIAGLNSAVRRDN